MDKVQQVIEKIIGKRISTIIKSKIVGGSQKFEILFTDKNKMHIHVNMDNAFRVKLEEVDNPYAPIDIEFAWEFSRPASNRVFIGLQGDHAYLIEKLEKIIRDIKNDNLAGGVSLSGDSTTCHIIKTRWNDKPNKAF